METTINQRIKMIVENSGKAITAYAAIIGVSQPTLKSCVDGDNSPRFDTLQKILIGNPMISAEWLMRGEGDMFRHAGQHVGDIIGSTAVVNHGDGNSIANNDTTTLQSKYLDLLAKKDQQIDRLLSIIEKLGK